MVQFAQRHGAVDNRLFLRHRVPQQGFKFCRRHVLDVTGLVMEQALSCIGVRGTGALHGNFCFQTDILHTGTDQDLIVATLDLPAVGLDIPVAERLIVQRDGDGLALPRLEEDFGKTLQLFGGAKNRCIRLCHIQLRNFCTSAAAGVGERKSYMICIYLQIAIRKGGIAQAVAKGIPYCLVHRFIITVAHIQAFPVLGVLPFAGEVSGSGGVLIPQGNGLRQLAAGVLPAGQHVQHGTGSGLTAQVAVHNSLALCRPVGLNDAARADDRHHVGVGRRHGVQQLLLHRRNADMGTV